MNKTIVIGIVVFFVVIGGIFLYLAIPSSPSSEEEYSATPTKWSQAGDYKIEETLDGTVIINEAAGFSFKVPDGWSVENQKGELEREYILNILSPDATFEKDEFGNNIAILGGCILSIETEYQKDTVAALSTRIASVRENPSRYKRDTSREEVVEISGEAALKTFLTPPLDSEYYKQFGESIRVEFSLDEESLGRFGIRFLEKNKENCLDRFEEFSNNFVI